MGGKKAEANGSCGEKDKRGGKKTEIQFSRLGEIRSMHAVCTFHRSC